MDKNDIEELRRFYEMIYRQENSTAIVVVAELEEVDTIIGKYYEKGYAFFDSNRFGAMGARDVGEFLVFVKEEEE